MALSKLYPSPDTNVPIQDTTLGRDVLGRYFANTLPEAFQGPPYDVVVIGSGMYGAYAASKFFKMGGGSRPRVLVLEAGPFLLAEHIQNFPYNLGYEVFTGVTGQPYLSNISEQGQSERPESVADHYYCVGGKSLGWGKWSPRLTDSDLAKWPLELAERLRKEYPIVETEMGVQPTSDFIYGPLYDALMERSAQVLPNLSSFTSVEPPPIAAQSNSTASGLYSFDAFSSAALLFDSIREDVRLHGPDAQYRKLVLVPKSRVYRLEIQDKRIVGLHTLYGNDNTPEYFPLSDTSEVYLALGTTESTRLVLNSRKKIENELVGRNLMVHLRTDFDVRIHRSALPSSLPERLEAAALHLQGEQNDRRFHLQVFAAADSDFYAEKALYKMVPHLEDVESLLSSQIADWVSLRVLISGELTGDPSKPLYSSDSCWMDLSKFDFDEYGAIRVPRAFVKYNLSPEDDDFWLDIHDHALSYVSLLAGDQNKIQFKHEDGSWSHNRPSRSSLRAFRNSLGSTFHEAGTMWMGEDASTSVTDLSGRLHQFQNLFCIDQSIFPTVGSANPVLTGLALIRSLVSKRLNLPSPYIEPELLKKIAGDLKRESLRRSKRADLDIRGERTLLHLEKILETLPSQLGNRELLESATKMLRNS